MLPISELVYVRYWPKVVAGALAMSGSYREKLTHKVIRWAAQIDPKPTLTTAPRWSVQFFSKCYLATVSLLGFVPDLIFGT